MLRVVYVLQIALLMSVPGCRRSPVVDSSDESAPMTAEQRTLALDAIERLRTALNGGDFSSIYTDATDSFRVAERRSDWEWECKQFREKLGNWQSFTLRDASTHIDGAHVDGLGIFEKATRPVEIVLRLNSERAQFDCLSLEDGGGQWSSLPSDRYGQHKFWDSPMQTPSRR
jgi:hypothetical protein